MHKSLICALVFMFEGGALISICKTLSNKRHITDWECRVGAATVSELEN